MLALALVGAGCQQPETNVPEQDEFAPDLTAVEQGVGVNCAQYDACSATGSDGAIYTSTYRIGNTPTSRGEFLQLFKAPSTGAPNRIAIAPRHLRAFTLPPGTPPKLIVEIYGPIANLNRPELTGSPKAVGEVAINALDPSGVTVIDLEALDILEADSTYAFRLYSEDLPTGTTGTVLIGVGALVNTTVYADGAPFRRGLRRSSTTPGATYGESRWQTAGSWDLAFGLKMSNGEGDLCTVDIGCASGLYCAKLASEPNNQRRCRPPVTISAFSPTGTAVSTIAQIKVTFEGNVDPSTVPASAFAVTGGVPLTIAWDHATNTDVQKTATLTASVQYPYELAHTVTLTGAGVHSFWIPQAAANIPLSVTNSPISDGSNFKWGFTTRADGNRNPWRGTFSSGAGWSQDPSGTPQYKLFSITAEVQPQGRATGSDGTVGYSGFIGATHRDHP